jgi:predicted Zn-dependent protease
MTAACGNGGGGGHTGKAAGLWLAAFLGLLSSGCANQSGEGPGHRRQSLALDRYQELDLGKQAYDAVLYKYWDRHAPDDDPRLERIRRVGMRLVRASEIPMLQREINLRVKDYDWEWEFALIKNDEANAFCLPGGKVVVFSGLLPVAENDDELATGPADS